MDRPMTARFLILCLRTMLALMWAPAALATTVLVLDGSVQIPLAMTVLSTLIASLSGATALVLRIDSELRKAPDAKLPRPWLFASAHMLGSWLAGTLAFIMSQQWHSDVWVTLGFVLVASFLGAKFIEAIAEKYLARPLPEDKP
jgi:VanZ family protein